MANSLLDFVMSVVRDPDAAAAYAANPTQAIADAHLTDVTSVDVNNLIPVVAESMSAAVPSGGSSGFAGGADTLVDAAHNVWASGAATAAFDAFGDHLPLDGGGIVADHVSTVANVIDLPETPTIDDHVIDTAAPFDEVPVTDAPDFSDVHAMDTVAVEDGVHGTDHVGVDHLEHPQDPGFDIFT